MAAFPSNIPWSQGSSTEDDLGIESVTMADRRAHVQTQVSAAPSIVNFQVINEPLSDTEVATVKNFLRNNYADIQITDPISLVTYSGKMTSQTIRSRWLSAVHTRLTWTFNGESV